MMRLAERRGVSVQQLLSDYSVKELNLWRVWVTREPSEMARLEWVMAQLLAITHNVNHEKKDRKKVQDFILKSNWDKPKKRKELNELTPEEQERAINRAFGF